MKIKRYLRYVNRRIDNYEYFVKNKSKILLSKNEFFRLKKSHQHEKTFQSAVFNNNEICFISPFWFLHSIDEIFVQEVYKFSSQVKNPLIIDCGSNIGLSVIYFKQLNIEAKIIAFEADPSVFAQLEKNIDKCKYKDINLINGAVWKERTTLKFISEGSVGGMLNLASSNEGNQIEIDAFRLRDYLQQPVDFLKIDIEGAEYEVLKDCRDQLKNVKNLFIEYHVLPNEDQKLHEILDWVQEAGFKYYLREAWNNMSYPFMQKFNDYYQMQLNIFCYRQISI